MKIFHFHNVKLLRSNVMPPIEDLLATVLDAARVHWRSQPENLGEAKIFEFRRLTLFCLEKRPSKHKMTIFSKSLVGSWPHFAPSGYAYARVLGPLP